LKTASPAAKPFLPKLEKSIWSLRPRAASETTHQCVGTATRERAACKGFVVSRQRGSHRILVREKPHARVVVPNHKQICPGALNQILSEAGLDVAELMDLL